MGSVSRQVCRLSINRLLFHARLGFNLDAADDILAVAVGIGIRFNVLNLVLLLLLLLLLRLLLVLRRALLLLLQRRCGLHGFRIPRELSNLVVREFRLPDLCTEPPRLAQAPTISVQRN